MPKKNGLANFEENFPGADIGGDEWAFIQAIAAYQKTHGRRYPTWREVLLIAQSLGYRKVADPGPLPKPPEDKPDRDE